MSNSNDLVISSIDCRCSVGTNLIESAAAVRAGLNGLRTHPSFIPLGRSEPNLEPVNAGYDYSIKQTDWQRLVSLIESPLNSVIMNSGIKRTDFDRIDLMFSLPFPDKASKQAQIKENLFENLMFNLEYPEPKLQTGTQRGSTGTIHLIEKARETIVSGETDAAILIAVDSYNLMGRMNILDDNWRLKSQRCPTGFSPGEASTVLLLERRDKCIKKGRKPLLTIKSTGFGQEENTIRGDKSSTATGLGKSIVDAVKNAKLQTIDWLYSDLNGEAYKGYEWGIVRVRHGSLFTEPLYHMHTADVTGDIGAATTAFQLACMSQSSAKSYAPSRNAFFFAGNDAGHRAAMCVTDI